MSDDSMRAGGRRPIEEWEVPLLEAFGADLRAAREGAGMTRVALSEAAVISEFYALALERAWRRPRRSTLDRLAFALTDADPTLGDPDVLVERWCELLGPALAPPTRGERKRTRRRVERQLRIRQAAEKLAVEMAKTMVAEERARSRRHGGSR